MVEFIFSLFNKSHNFTIFLDKIMFIINVISTFIIRFYFRESDEYNLIGEKYMYY